MTLKEAIKLLVPLLAAAYLGFYIFALMMGVFALGEVVWLTVIAAISVLVLAAYRLARSRGMDPIDAGGPAARRALADREKRGY